MSAAHSFLIKCLIDWLYYIDNEGEKKIPQKTNYRKNLQSLSTKLLLLNIAE